MATANKALQGPTLTTTLTLRRFARQGDISDAALRGLERKAAPSGNTALFARIP